MEVDSALAVAAGVGEALGTRLGAWHLRPLRAGVGAGRTAACWAWDASAGLSCAHLPVLAAHAHRKATRCPVLGAQVQERLTASFSQKARLAPSASAKFIFVLASYCSRYCSRVCSSLSQEVSAAGNRAEVV